MNERKRVQKRPKEDAAFVGHLSCRDQSIVVDAELLRKVGRLRSWFRLLSDAEIVERMTAVGMDITEQA
jgi:hypothetical protein